MHQLVRFLCAGMVQCADTAATLFVYSLSALAAGVGYEARHPQGEMAPQLVPAPRTEPSLQVWPFPMPGPRCEFSEPPPEQGAARR